MSKEFEGTYGNKLGTESSSDSWADKASLIIENLIKIAATTDYHTPMESKSVDLLSSLQSRARLLIQQ